jgi:hypothetical protein
MGLYKFKAFFGVCKKWMLPGSDTENSVFLVVVAT